MANEPTQEQLDDLAFMRTQANALLRELSLDSTWTMASEALWPDVAAQYYWEELHRPICDRLDNAPSGDNTMIIISRRHSKTMLFTVAYIVRLICKYPNIRILLVSCNDNTAKEMCKLVVRQFKINEHFRRVFPDKAVDPNAQVGDSWNFTHPSRTSVGLLSPTVKATYLGGPLISQRFDVIVADDCIEDKQVATPELAAKSITEFTDLIPLIEVTSPLRALRVYGTYKSYNDLYHSIEAATEGKAANIPGKWNIIRRCVIENDKGEPDFDGTHFILPNVFNRRVVEETLEMYRADEKLGESSFWREYFLKVIPPGQEKFKEEWFNGWLPRLPAGIVKSYITADKATKDEQVLFKGDFMVYLCGHFDTYGNLYLTDGERSDAWRTRDSFQHLAAMGQRASCFNVVKEKVGDDSWFGGARDYFNNLRLPLNLYPVKVRQMGKKAVRIIDCLQAPMMAKKVWFVEGFPRDLHKVLVEEATHLGQWSHDDAIDCLALFYHPEVKVVAASQVGAKWKQPVPRYAQPGTAFSNPGLYAKRVQVREDPTLQSKDGSRILDMGQIMGDDEPPWFKP